MKLCERRKEPYTMAELYKIVEEKLKKDGNWPDDIIDYTLVVNQNIEVLDNAFDVVPQVQYGSCEGIFLDVYFIGSGFTNSEADKVRLCTVKTLDTSRDAMRKMAILGADFVVDTSEFLNRNSDDFDWKYYSVRIVEEDGSLGCGYSCRSLSVAERKFDEFAKKAQHIVLFDKSTRKILKEHKKGE